MGIERSTFLINKDGELVKEWRKVKVKGHIEDVLSYINKSTLEIKYAETRQVSIHILLPYIKWKCRAYLLR